MVPNLAQYTAPLVESKQKFLSTWLVQVQYLPLNRWVEEQNRLTCNEQGQGLSVSTPCSDKKNPLLSKQTLQWVAPMSPFCLPCSRLPCVWDEHQIS
jgi:hypothetical protein